MSTRAKLRSMAPDTGPSAPEGTPASTATETCDYCGSDRLEWRKCKLICLNCHQIVKSCEDL